MTPERWETINTMWSKAVQLEPADRLVYLAQACGDDQELHKEVSNLLANADSAAAEDFLGVPPWALDEIPLTLPDFGDFERIEYVGHGGMGVVFRAHQRSLNRTVALKICHTSGIFNDADERRFRAEAEHMARLRHPNIAHVYEVGTREDRPYFCMEFVEGTNLRKHQSELQAKPRDAAKLIRTVAMAVHHAHLRGLLHRDLKPANILLDKTGQPRVTDFGLAKRIDREETEEANEVSVFRGAEGTAAFMSPEQLEGSDEQQTTLCDVFGLAAILYALLTGRGPHQGNNWNETIANLKRCTPIPINAVNQSVDRDLGAVCMKSLAKEPGDRHSSAQDLAGDLDCWLNGKETSSKKWGLLQRMHGWQRRNRVLASLVAGLLLLLVVVVVLLGQLVVEFLQEPELAQLTLAKQQASILDLRIRQLAAAVTSVAKDPALAKALASGNRDHVYRFVNNTGAERIDLDGQSPFASWFVMDQDGTIVARWPDLPDSVQNREFTQREYFSGAIRDPTSTPHITRVFRSVADDYYKFGISVAIRTEGKLLGVLAASVPTSSTLGLPFSDQDHSHTVVFAGVDPSSKADGKLAGCERVVLVHPAYKKGAQPVCIRDAELAPVAGIHKRYRDPIASIDTRFGGFWLGALEPVGNTGFTVLMQRRYPGSDNLRILMLAGPICASLFLLASVFFGRRLHRVPSSTARGPKQTRAGTSVRE